MTRLSFITFTAFLALLLTACGSATAPASISAAATSTAAAPTPMPPTSTTQPTAEATPLPSPAPTPTPAVTPTEGTKPGTTVAEEQVTIKLFMFKPAPLDVKPGTRIVWTNQDAIEHSVTAGTPDKPGGLFDSDFFTQGGTFTFTFDQPGEYLYFCKRHESMIGKINVTAP